VLTGVIAHVLNWRAIDSCGAAGGALPTSPTLNRLTLPADPPGPRFEVSAELNELLRPDEASRIRVLTGLDHPEEVMQGLLFRLRVELRFNKDGADQSGPDLPSGPAAEHGLLAGAGGGTRQRPVQCLRRGERGRSELHAEPVRGAQPGPGRGDHQLTYRATGNGGATGRPPALTVL
jgi:hypothetical protein